MRVTGIAALRRDRQMRMTSMNQTGTAALIRLNGPLMVDVWVFSNGSGWQVEHIIDVPTTEGTNIKVSKAYGTYSTRDNAAEKAAQILKDWQWRE